MVETVEVTDNRTGETVECYYAADAKEVSGMSRRTWERRVEKKELTRLRYRNHAVHPVTEIRQLFGDRPGGAPPPPKPRPNPGPPQGDES